MSTENAKTKKPSIRGLRKKLQTIFKNFQRESYEGKEETKALEMDFSPEQFEQYKNSNERPELKLGEEENTGSILAEIDEAVLFHSMTPSQYFMKIKELQENITSDTLQETLNISSEILNRLRRSGQKPLAEKLMRKMTILIKERNAALAGFTNIINTNDIYVWVHEIEVREHNGETVSPIKIAALEDYMRVIPDDVLEKLDAAKPIFDTFYIVFTDYTGETERHIEQEKKDKDPILFGAFLTPRDNGRLGPADHLFFIADWEDEYCDLTLTQMIESFQKASGREMLVVPDELIGAQINEIKKEFKLS